MSCADGSEPAGPALAPLAVERWGARARVELPRHLRRPELYLSGEHPMPGALGLLAHHPALGAGWLAFTDLLSGTEATLDPRLRELAILRVAWRARSAYEWLQHARIARHAGVTAAEVHAVPDGPDAAAWGPLERAVLQAADDVADRHGVDPATSVVLAAHLDEAQRLELTFVIGAYLCFAVVATSAGLPADLPTEPVDAPALPPWQGRGGA